MNKFIPQRTSAYISQHDLHIGEMTVRETLAFSARCQGIGARYDMLAKLSRREKEANIKPYPDLDVFLKAASLEGQKASVILGLDVCADTMVGDDMFRGIFGGQKQRVTTKAFNSCHIARKLADKLSVPFDKANSHPAALTTKKYGISEKEL
ncbi:hypothetical protein RHSIM_Rhsim04G0112900 [Rhododendron simsii]|uniref:Uncharacterized protein n=1 Tax=Rhododendron simsii TaxID=118357 RepID=A0A834H3G2_RHOSS|nr:hypothetical protein RHSIM_Rhsim04G0112900 [Rhododendron simsii]